ncbi:protein FAM166B isoform X2 [Mesocricetus auratus]|uniref:Ciliary microtubule inner protein 2B n=1 Tax=Mesocricetus auratus TaxID=10036 RepID=A0A3Q0D533_MESAU|nr:protein FAM166B isoform X2 [Mesocricetus auratus]
MAAVSTFIPGLNPQNPHYIPGYTGHCPLLQFSMGQTYGQVTRQLLRGPPGLAWPPAHRTLLPPIQPPRSPVIARGRLPPRRGHERLSSSVIPGYTGFIPQAQFIFAKNCNQVWAEAMTGFTQRCGQQESHELSKEAKGGEVERDEGLEAEELTQEEPQVSPYSMDDTDPQKFFMSGPTSRTWVSSLTMEATCQGISSSLAVHLGISPMMLWASAPLRNSSWLKYHAIPVIFLEGIEAGRGRGTKKMVWRLSTFLLIGVINK